MTSEHHEPQDPRPQAPQPPFPKQRQEPPGLESQMQPEPDFGEQTYRGYGRLEGRAALITGADSGIGRAIALAYAREGADVLISYLEEDSDAQKTAKLVEDAGRKAVLMAGDVGDERHCQQLVERAFQAFGHLDILVNNAGYQRTHQSITEIPAGEIERTFRTNLFAMFYLCKAAFPRMPEGGAIINTTSIEAYHPKPYLLDYAASKAAIVSFTKAFAEEAMQRGIRVNGVAPGPVWTPLIPSTMPEKQVTQFGKSYPIGRPAQPAELAPVYVFLASDESRYVSGEIVGVTGGHPL